MNELSKDVLIGSLFIAGIWTFISGLFVMSTVLFATTSVVGNMTVEAR